MLQAPQTGPDAPWKRRCTAPGILSFQLARQNPGRGLAISLGTGVPQAHAWDLAAGTLRPLSGGESGIGQASLAPDGRHVYYLDDPQGTEIGHYVRIPWEDGRPEDLTPDLPPYSAVYQTALSQAGNMFAFTPNDAAGVHLDCVPLAPDGRPGPPRRLFSGTRMAHDVTLSYGGDIAVIASTERAATRQYGLLAFDTASGEALAELWDIPAGSIRPVCFAPRPDDTRLLAWSDRTGAPRPLLWDPRAGTRHDLAVPVMDGDLLPLDWAPDGARLLLCQVHRAEQRLYTYDLATGTAQRLDHPPGMYCFPGAPGTCFGPGGEIVALWESSTHPPVPAILDGATGRLERLLLPPADLPPTRAFRPVRFPSSDGTEVQGWLALPDGPGPFPTVLTLHGGPHMAVGDMFDPLAHAWVDHGYACLAINYRGSTGFGRAFQEQIWGDLGHWEVEDIVAGRAWLVAQGLARPDAVLLTGGSYGGYLTLQALGKYPDLWAGGMAAAAEADLVQGYAEVADSYRGWYKAMMGGTPAEKPEAYAAASPSTYVDRVQAPVLLIHGRNDTRCPPGPIEAYAARLRARGRPATVDWYELGHASLGMDAMIGFQEEMLRFAYACLAPIMV